MKRFLVAAFAALLCACATEHTSAQSWDQENLKRNDHGCPTAIFIAPAGELIQCQPAAPEPAADAEPAHSILPGFPTIEEAAIDGLKSISQKSTANYYEWGGTIIKAANGYVPVVMGTNYAAQHVHIDDVPGAETVGTFHTHVCNSRFAHEYFSPADLGEPYFQHRSTFMGDMCTGLVHRAKSGEKLDVEQINGDGPWSTTGTIVGRFTTEHSAL